MELIWWAFQGTCKVIFSHLHRLRVHHMPRVAKSQSTSLLVGQIIKLGFNPKKWNVNMSSKHVRPDQKVQMSRSKLVRLYLISIFHTMKLRKLPTQWIKYNLKILENKIEKSICKSVKQNWRKKSYLEGRFWKIHKAKRSWMLKHQKITLKLLHHIKNRQLVNQERL